MESTTPDMGDNMLTPGGILIRNPRLLHVTDPVDPAGDPADDPQDTPKFPANTPVKDMTPEQQAAFHENKARKLEDKLKGFNGLTPKQIADLQTEIATLKTKTQTADERAIDEAKEAGRSEVRTQLAAERVKNVLEKALAGRIPDAGALLDFDRSQFVDGDKADVAAITKWVAENSTEAVAPKKAPNLGQGHRESVTPTRGERGREEARKRFQKTKTSTDS